MTVAIALDALAPGCRLCEELHGADEPFVWFGTTEAQKPLSGNAETLATQAGHAEFVVGSFEQVHGQAVGSKPCSLADFRDIRKCVEGSRGHLHCHFGNAPEGFY